MVQQGISESHYEELTAYQQQVEAKDDELKEARAASTELKNQIESLESEGRQKDAALQARDRELARLTTQIGDSKSRLDDQIAAYKTLEEYLAKAHADTNVANKQLKQAHSDGDNLKVELRAAQLQLEDLTEQWHAEQGKVQQLHEYKEHVEQLDTEISVLQEDITTSNQQIDEQKRVIDVKDKRIQNLEQQLQKALESIAENVENADNARAAAIASSSTPFDEPPIIRTEANSLATELAMAEEDELHDDSEYGSEGDRESYIHELDISGITAVDTAPVAPALPTLATTATQTDAPVLRFSGVSAIDTQPTALAPAALTTTSTQTDPQGPNFSDITAIATDPVELPLPALTTVFTQTDAPRKPALSIVAEIASVEPSEPFEIVEPPPNQAFDALVQTDTELLTAGYVQVDTKATQTSATPAIASERTKPAAIVSTFGNYFLPYTILALFTLGLFMTWFDLRAWNNANSAFNRYDYYGAYGNPRYLFGVIPIGYDVGSGPWSEAFAKYVSFAVQTIEDQLGHDGLVYNF